MSHLIFTLIPKIMQEVGAISKEKKFSGNGFSYNFRGIEDMYLAIQPALVKHGVFCAPEVIHSESTVMEKQNQTGQTQFSYRTLIRVRHRFYASDGSYVDVTTQGEGIDTSDKASNKAMSAAMKYAFIELLSIPTQDIEDSDRESPQAEKAIKPASGAPIIRPENPPFEDGVHNDDRGGYRIPFGKFARRSLEEVAPRELAEYVTYIEKKAEKDGKPLTGQVLDFVDRAAEYLGALESA